LADHYNVTMVSFREVELGINLFVVVNPDVGVGRRPRIGVYQWQRERVATMRRIVVTMNS